MHTPKQIKWVFLFPNSPVIYAAPFLAFKMKLGVLIKLFHYR